MTPKRFQKIKDMLKRRQPDLTVITDNVHKPHNLAAIIRSCDAVGIGDIYCLSKNEEKLLNCFEKLAGAHLSKSLKNFEKILNAFQRNFDEKLMTKIRKIKNH